MHCEPFHEVQTSKWKGSKVCRTNKFVTLLEAMVSVALAFIRASDVHYSNSSQANAQDLFPES